MSPLLQVHLFTIIPVLGLGPFILYSQGKGSHKHLGRIWVLLMVISCLSTFGLTHQGQYSWLHALSLYTLFSAGHAVYAIKKNDLRTHKRSMIGSYIGTLIAFGWAVGGSGRLLNTFLVSFLN